MKAAIAFLPLVVLPVAFLLACGGESRQYEVVVRFDETVPEEEIELVNLLLRDFDSHLQFIIQESFPPTGVARLKTQADDLCTIVREVLEPLPLIRAVECYESQDSGILESDDALVRTLEPGERYQLVVWLKPEASEADAEEVRGRLLARHPDGTVQEAKPLLHRFGAAFTTDQRDFCPTLERELFALTSVQDAWCHRNPIHGRIERQDVPEFHTADDLQDFIDGRHDRLAASARERPGMVAAATITPTQELTPEQIEEITVSYQLMIYQVDFRAGEVGGSMAANVETLKAEAAKLAGQGPLLVTTFKVEASIAELHRLATSEPLVGIVDADSYLDRRAGLVDDDVTTSPPRSLFEDYQRLILGAE